MPPKRSSARIASKSSENLAADASSSPANENKRKATDSSPAKGAAKKSKKATPKKQTTLEQTMDLEKEGDGENKEVDVKDDGKKDVEMKEAGSEEKDGETKEADGEGEFTSLGLGWCRT